MGSDELRCGIEQTGGFGRFGFHRSWCLRHYSRLVGIHRRILPRSLASGLLSRFGSGGLGSLLHLCFGSFKRVLEFQVAGNEMEQGLGKLSVEILHGAGDADWCRQSIVVTVGDLFRDDVDPELVVYDLGHGGQDCAMQNKRRKLSEHGTVPWGMKFGIVAGASNYSGEKAALTAIAHLGNGSNH